MGIFIVFTRPISPVVNSPMFTQRYTTVLDAILLPRLCSMVSTPMQVRHSIRHRAQLMATTMVQYSVQSLMPLRYQLSQPMVCHM